MVSFLMLTLRTVELECATFDQAPEEINKEPYLLSLLSISS